MKHRCDRRQRTVEAQQQSDQTQVRNGRIRQQALQVVLEHGRITAQQQRDGAGAAHHPEPFLGAAQHRPQPGHQKHPGLDHGGRVQIGRHRGGRGHGMRQPEVKRKLRAFGQRAQQHQHQRRQVQRVVAHLFACGQHMVQVVAAHHVANQEHAGQQAQPAGASHRQRHARAAPGVLPVVPVANQQKGKQAGQLPEKSQLHQVARQHQPDHGTHEGKEKGEKTRHRVGCRHVIARIQHHQSANAQHQHAEHPGKAVHAQHQVQAQRRQPVQFLTDHAAVGNRWKIQRCLHGTHQRNHTGQGGLGVAGIGGQHGSHQTAQKRQQDKENQGHVRRILEASHAALL